MYGQVLPYKQIQSFRLSNETGSDLVNKNKFQTSNAVGNFNIYGAIKLNTEFFCDKSTSTFASLGSTIGKWAGGILAPNGYIYCTPYVSSTFLKINPNDLTSSTFGSLSGSNRFAGAALIGDRIFYIPADFTSVGVLDTNTDSFKTLPNAFSGSSQYLDCAVASNGCIYGSPFNSNVIPKIDPLTESISFIPKIGSVTYRACIPYGNFIYFFPTSANRVMRLNVINDTVELVGSSITANYISACLAVNRCAYLIPFLTTSVLKYNLETFEQKNVGSVTLVPGKGQFAGGALCPDGKIYCAVQETSYTTLIIDTNNDTLSNSGFTGTANGRFYGAVLADNGKVFFIPYESSTIGVMNNTNPIDPNFPRNRHFNKL